MTKPKCISKSCSYPETCDWNNMCMVSQLEKSNAVKIYETPTSKVGVVLCHGFLSKHEQMIPLSNYIYETLGWETSLVELAGHGYDEENITNVTWNNWVNDVKKCYTKLKERCDVVFMIGFSLGGCISAYVASMKKIKPGGIVIINGVFGVKNIFNKLLPGLMIYNKMCEKFNLQKFMMESITNNSEAPDLNQSVVNMSATNELRKMSNISFASLDDVLCPTLVIQEYNDPTVFYGTGVKAFKKLGSTFKRFHKTKLNTHLTIYDKGLECNVFCKISKFLKDVVEHKFVNIAHRGASGDFPENTLIAFEEAINRGCDMIELDVQRIGSKLRVFHDHDFQRMFGLDTNVKDISEEDVIGLTYPNLEKIPTLEEALECIDGRVDVNIEIKGSHIATNIAGVARNYLSKPSWKYSDIILSSFSQAEINMLRHQYADLSLSYLLYEQYCNLRELMGIKQHYFEKNIHSINLPIEEISEEIVEYCNDNDMRIYVYTANELKEIRYLRELGVDGVFTDYPSRIQ